MAVNFLKKGTDARWELYIEGFNDDGSVRPSITQAMLESLMVNPWCRVDFEGTVEVGTRFKLSVKSFYRV
jgi:hypothetical protein